MPKIWVTQHTIKNKLEYTTKLGMKRKKMHQGRIYYKKGTDDLTQREGGTYKQRKLIGELDR